ncbi:MAG: molybdopterin-dependent oxidoreductase, partial [Solirubrobacteraceae bacterium]
AGGRTIMLSRAALLALPQRTHDLPIACVEGWTTTQRWTGVRISELAAMVGAGEDATVLVESLQKGGSFRRATLGAAQVRDDRSLLALRVNGVDLALDHGFPARVIVPALPGVHNTKWVKTMTFGAPA